MSDFREFNINQEVMVQLTDEGRRIHRQQWDDLRAAYPGIYTEYTPPHVDENGWSRFQLWHLMDRFGDSVQMGVPSPFQMVIRFNERDLNQVEAGE